MIQAVVFDNGGVITAGGRGFEQGERFSELVGIPLADARALLAAPWEAFTTGKIDEATYWLNIEKLYGKPIDPAQRKIWNTWDYMKPRPELIEFISSLKARGLRVGMLSNVIPVTEQIIREHGVYELFNPCLLSCKEGMAKPEPAFYRLLLERLGLTAEEVIFVDDQERCLIPARELGFKTVQAVNGQQIIDDVENLITLNNHAHAQ